MTTNTPDTAPTMPDRIWAHKEKTPGGFYNSWETNFKRTTEYIRADLASREPTDGVKVIEGLEEELAWWDSTGGGHGPHRTTILQAARAYLALQQSAPVAKEQLQTTQNFSCSDDERAGALHILHTRTSHLGCCLTVNETKVVCAALSAQEFKGKSNG